MARLFSKLNTLLRARIEGLLEDDLRLPRRRFEDRSVPGRKVLAQEIDALRREINAALDYEDDLQTRIDALRQDASDLDIQVDNALLARQEDIARRSLEQLRRTEQQITMLEADLTQHRQHVAALMDRVNLLEGLAAEAESRQGETPETGTAPAMTPAEETSPQAPVAITPGDPQTTAGPLLPESPPSPVTEEELAARRMRLARGTTQKE